MLETYRNIKRFREMKEMSQDELAKRSGYTDRSSIARIERGDVDVPQSKILAIAAALGVTASELMGTEGTQEISGFEQSLIRAYRSASDDTQAAVCAVLGLKRDASSAQMDVS